jgi:hypothetical protein
VVSCRSATEKQRQERMFGMYGNTGADDSTFEALQLHANSSTRPGRARDAAGPVEVGTHAGDHAATDQSPADAPGTAAEPQTASPATPATKLRQVSLLEMAQGGAAKPVRVCNLAPGSASAATKRDRGPDAADQVQPASPTQRRCTGVAHTGARAHQDAAPVARAPHASDVARSSEARQPEWAAGALQPLATLDIAAVVRAAPWVDQDVKGADYSPPCWQAPAAKCCACTIYSGCACGFGRCRASV